MIRLTRRQGLWLLTTLLLLAACGQRLLALWPQPAREIAVRQTQVETTPPPLDSAALAKLTLFAAPAPAVAVENGPLAFRVGVLSPDSPRLREAPPTLLKARLTGLLSGPRGIAIIEQGGRQQSYGPGDRLAANAELVRIFHDRIIISRQGQYESLLLK